MICLQPTELEGQLQSRWSEALLTAAGDRTREQWSQVAAREVQIEHGGGKFLLLQSDAVLGQVHVEGRTLHHGNISGPSLRGVAGGPTVSRRMEQGSPEPLQPSRAAPLACPVLLEELVEKRFRILCSRWH